jgi:hypothetical protein
LDAEPEPERFKGEKASKESHQQWPGKLLPQEIDYKAKLRYLGSAAEVAEDRLLGEVSGR